MLLLDQAGWHLSEGTVVPINITLLPLPAKNGSEHHRCIATPNRRQHPAKRPYTDLALASLGVSTDDTPRYDELFRTHFWFRTVTLPRGWADSWQGQALRFTGVGLTTAGIDFGILTGLGVAGVSPYVARVASIIVALVVSWWLNRRLTFRSSSPPNWREFATYAATAAVGASINYGLYSVGLYVGMPLWLAFVIGTGVAAVFNFLRYRLLLAPHRT